MTASERAEDRVRAGRWTVRTWVCLVGGGIAGSAIGVWLAGFIVPHLPALPWR